MNYPFTIAVLPNELRLLFTIGCSSPNFAPLSITAIVMTVQMYVATVELSYRRYGY